MINSIMTNLGCFQDEDIVAMTDDDTTRKVGRPVIFPEESHESNAFKRG